MAKERKVIPVTTRTITPTVFLTGQYQVNAETKAVELTRLMQSLLVSGVFPNALAAVEKGVPAGTYVVIDDPETPEEDFSVQIVPRIFKKKGDAEEVVVEPKA